MHSPQQLALEVITAGRNHARGNRKPPRVAQLAASIRASGWISPVQVRDQGDGTFELVAGFRRFAAAQLLGLDQIPVQLLDFESARAINLAENTREAVPPVERGLAWARSIAAGMRVADVAALSDVSAAQVSRLASAVKRLHPDVLEHYRNRDCTQALLIGLSWQSEAKQLRAITATRNPQRSVNRKRARRAQDIRVAIRELAKRPRSIARDSAMQALQWAVRDRADLVDTRAA